MENAVSVGVGWAPFLATSTSVLELLVAQSPELFAVVTAVPLIVSVAVKTGPLVSGSTIAVNPENKAPPVPGAGEPALATRLRVPSGLICQMPFAVEAMTP